MKQLCPCEGCCFAMAIPMQHICSWIETSYVQHKNRVHHRVRVSTDKNALYETYPNLEHKEHATWRVCSARKPTSPSQMPGSCQNLQGEFCLLCEMPSRCSKGHLGILSHGRQGRYSLYLTCVAKGNIVISTFSLFLWSINRIPYIVKYQQKKMSCIIQYYFYVFLIFIQDQLYDYVYYLF